MYYLQCDSYDHGPDDNGHNYTIGDHHLYDHAGANNNSFTHNNSSTRAVHHSGITKVV